MKTTIVLNNVPADKVDETIGMLEARGYDPVVKVPEDDGEFTIIGYKSKSDSINEVMG